MLFNSIRFAVFFPTVYILYLILPHRWQNRLLLVASYIFYGSWDWRFLSLIAISTIIDYYCGDAIHRTEDQRRRRGFMLLSLCVNLGLLGVFKYFNFFAESFQELLSVLGFQVDAVTLHIILPVGISFYTFQTLSYTIDIYRKKLSPEPNWVNFALFVSFFPQLVAGPIERAKLLLPQIRSPRTVTLENVTRGIWFVFWGFFLKVFVADNLAPIVNGVFSGSQPEEGARVLIAIYAFAFQIFGDFAGYSSIAIGIALLMGFKLSTNFLFPYFVTNPRAFWHNWHISLSTWLKDYLYIPLGGNRGSTSYLYRNLFLTMLLGGLWHGAAWTFVIWGAFHGFLLIGHRIIDTALRARPMKIHVLVEKPWSFVKVLVMFHVTCLGWLIFRSGSVEQIGTMLNSILTMPLPSQSAVFLGLQLAFFTWLPLTIQFFHKRSRGETPLERLPRLVRFPLLMLMLFSMLIWGSYGGQEFIYFQF